MVPQRFFGTNRAYINWRIQKDCVRLRGEHTPQKNFVFLISKTPRVSFPYVLFSNSIHAFFIMKYDYVLSMRGKRHIFMNFER